MHVQADKLAALQRLDQLQDEKASTGSEADREMASLQKALNACTAELSLGQSQLASERERLRSLESSLASIESSDSERLSAERRAAEERAAERSQRDKAHAEEIAALQDKTTKTVAKLKQDMANARSEWEKLERDLRKQYEDLRRTKEQEVEEMSRWVKAGDCAICLWTCRLCLMDVAH